LPDLLEVLCPMIYRTLNYEKAGFVAVIRMNGPDYDGITPRLVGEFGEVCNEIAWDEEVRVVVLICDAAVVQPIEEAGEQCSDEGPSLLVESLAKLTQPVIGAIVGDGIALGLEIAMACDVRIGTEGACFGLPQIRDGAVPRAGGTQRLPRLVGRGKALEMVLTGELVDAAEALRIGLINRIVPPDQLVEQATRLAREMAEKSPLAVSYVKEALYKGMDLTLDQGLRTELDLYLLLFTTNDRVEGVTAFKEKRKPKFEGT
jgi:enoyl-CoA hydratase/carnithine racemase